MKTIEIPENLYNELIGLAKEYCTQNNRGTADPLYFSIEDQENIVVDERFEFDYIEYHRDYEEVIACVEDAYQYIEEDVAAKNTHLEILRDKTNFDTYRFASFMEIYLPEFEQICFKKAPIYKNCFLTAKSCDNHLKVNHYHYNSTARSYGEHAWRNPDMEIIVKLLRTLGKVKDES